MELAVQNNTQMRRVVPKAKSADVKLAKGHCDDEQKELNLLNERLEVLRNLEDDWDDYGAKAPEASAVKGAAAALNTLGEEILHYCSLFPASDGGIYLTGHFKNESKFAVYFIDDSMTYIVKNGKDRTGGEDVAVKNTNLQKLKTQIKQICL